LKKPRKFKMPTRVKITGRTSSVTNSFVNGVIPGTRPTASEIAEVLAILCMSADDLRCAYCGDPTSTWDHFRPIVTGKRPTGFITEIANLVPACGPCNSSKGASHWRAWMTGSAELSPVTRAISDLASRIGRLEEFERWREPTVFDLEAAVGPELWTEYWAPHERLLKVMRECQVTADIVSVAIQRYIVAEGML
jgi:hypothetical protein